MNQQVFLYGSCVTRDGVDRWDHHHLSLNGYVSRQSLVSALHPLHKSLVDTSKVKSAFNQRMIQMDLQGAALQKITTALASGLPVIWDMTDERGGVLPSTEPAGFISGVAHSLGGKYLNQLSGERIWFGSAQFMELWISAFEALCEKLESGGLPLELMIINQIDWAELDNVGHPTKGPISASEFNSISSQFADFAHQKGMQIIKTNNTTADIQHKWGVAPFHFVEEDYERNVESLANVVHNLVN